MHPVPQIYAIVDQDTLGLERLADVAGTLAEAGVGWLQLRLKTASGLEAWRVAERTVRRLEGSGAALWIDDRADLAALFDVYGVHVGQEDLPPEAVRRVLGPELRIGRSTHDEAQFTAAAEDPDVDVVAFGPIFETGSKAGPDPVVGLDRLRRLRPVTDKPLVAIGGIDTERVAEVLAAGADTVALIGALGSASDSLAELARRARRLLRAAGAG